MKFYKSKIIKIILISVIVIVLSFLTIDKKIYNDFISSKISNYIKQSGIPVLIDSPKLFFTGIKSDSVSVNIPISNILLLFKFSNFKVKPSLLSFLSDTHKISFTASAYEGKLDGELNYIPNVSYDTSVNIDNVKISLHPQLASVGIKGGILDIKASNIHNSFKRNIPVSGDLKINLQGISIPLSSKLFKNLIPLNFKEDLNELSVKFSANFSDSKIIINLLKLDSNLIKLTGSGELSLVGLFSDRVKGILFDLSVAMTDQFTQTLSPNLIVPALIAANHRVNGKLDENTKAFSAQISGTLNHLFINITDTSSNLSRVDE